MRVPVAVISRANEHVVLFSCGYAKCGRTLELYYTTGIVVVELSLSSCSSSPDESQLLLELYKQASIISNALLRPDFQQTLSWR